MQYLCTHFPPLLSCGQSSSQLVSIRILLQLLARDQKYTYSERVDLTKNERTQEVCKYRLWYLKLVAGPFTIAVVLVGTMYPSTLEREIQFYAVALVPQFRTILPVLMATTRYIGTRSQTSFVPFARHLISISRVSVPVSLGCCGAAK